MRRAIKDQRAGGADAKVDASKAKTEDEAWVKEQIESVWLSESVSWFSESVWPHTTIFLWQRFVWLHTLANEAW